MMIPRPSDSIAYSDADYFLQWAQRSVHWWNGNQFKLLRISVCRSVPIFRCCIQRAHHTCANSRRVSPIKREFYVALDSLLSLDVAVYTAEHVINFSSSSLFAYHCLYVGLCCVNDFIRPQWMVVLQMSSGCVLKQLSAFRNIFQNNCSGSVKLQVYHNIFLLWF